MPGIVIVLTVITTRKDAGVNCRTWASPGPSKVVSCWCRTNSATANAGSIRSRTSPRSRRRSGVNVRQDYYFRYNEAIQLQLVGESLIGWMAWDLMRGVDLLLARPGIDKKRIILLGSVAAGGDSAAVAAALDPRITAVVPFNFGGPQPETRYPLPADAETSINWAGGGSWESTRNLRRSAADGFLPWVIVGSIAPRGLIYGHEFAWDKEHDPVYRRFETIWDCYGPNKHLAATWGRGAVTGKPPEATHCNNIGPEHRKGIYPALKQWFDMPIPEKDSTVRYKAEELGCVTPEVAKEMKPLHVLAGEVGEQRAGVIRAALKKLVDAGKEDRVPLREAWRRLLGDIEPKGSSWKVTRARGAAGSPSACFVEKVELEVEPGVVVPLLLLSAGKTDASTPIVIGLCHEGKAAAFSSTIAVEIADLLSEGVVVCLPDLRGTGETRAGDGRGRRSSATSLSSSELMLGQTLLGRQAACATCGVCCGFLRVKNVGRGSRIAALGNVVRQNESARQ